MQVVRTIVGTLAALLWVHAGFAATAEERLDGLQKRVSGAGGSATAPGAPQPSVEQALEWYGLLGASYRIRELEQKADGLVFGSGVRNALSERMKALEAQSQTQAVTAAEGGIGGGSRGLGWYCSKVAELEKALPERLHGFRLIVADYKAELGVIPIGHDDSVAQVKSLGDRFDQGLRDWRQRPETVAMDQDIKDVAAGLKTSRNTYGSFAGTAKAAADEARKLKTEAQELGKLGDQLIPRIDLYVTARNEVLRELQGLQLESAGALPVRDDLVKTVQGLHTPKSSASGWKTIVDDAAAQRSKDADQALARIDALTASISSEAAACADKSDPAGKFQALLQNAEQQAAQMRQEVGDAWAKRLQEIERVDREHAALIAENEQVAEDLGKRIVAAEEKYDALPQDSPERPRYENIVKARKIGADAAQAAIELRIERQGLQAEQQEVQRQSTVISGAINGQVTWELQWGTN